MALKTRFFVTLMACAMAAPLAAQETLLVSDTSAAEAADDQIGKPAGPPPTPEHTGIKATFRDLLTDFKHLPSLQNLMWVGIGAGGALAVHPADNSVNQQLIDASWSHKTFAAGAILGQSPTLLGAAGTIYVVGRAQGNGRLSHMGSDLIQAIAVSEAMTQGLKYSVRRERPDGSGPNSFPSGHAADTFAFATAIERHFGWKGAVPAYAFASYVALSRLHDNVHYTSDVVFGAAIGIIAGRTVTRPGHDLPIVVAAVPGGAAILYVRNGQ
jgi:membrane-associated phospholipid phosphatase